MTIFSGQSVISRVYTSRFGNGAARWNLDRSGTKKVSGTRYSTQWKTPQKLTVPYRAVPCSGKAPILSIRLDPPYCNIKWICLKVSARCYRPHVCRTASIHFLVEEKTTNILPHRLSKTLDHRDCVENVPKPLPVLL